MSRRLSTGAPELDMLLEELRAGDNVVFYTQEPSYYLPFVATMLAHVQDQILDLVYVRSCGLVDSLVQALPHLQVVDMDLITDSADPLLALHDSLRRIGHHTYTIFDPLSSYRPWFGGEQQVRDLFLTTCPLLFDLQSIAYWNLSQGQYDLATVAAIKDCTQVMVKVASLGKDLSITPLKVWGRYSETMLRSHRVAVTKDRLSISPLPIEAENQQAYMTALASKNKELAEIRDALHRSNAELVQRNEELAELNQRLGEQGRLYHSLRVNLDNLLELFQASQTIGSSLAAEQVRRAIVSAAVRLFDAPACRLQLGGPQYKDPVEVSQGLTPKIAEWVCHPLTVSARAEARTELRTFVAVLRDDAGDPLGSVAVSPIKVRGAYLGTLEVYSQDDRLDDHESQTLLGYLAAEASIALDNAHLYQEIEIQGKQLRSLVDEMITNEEQDSRRLAFDLHDGLVQMIVASYQHLQAAQAWHGRSVEKEEEALEQGIQLLRQAIYEARRLISQLRPAGLDDFGLVQAVRLHTAQLAADSDWQISLDVDPNWESLPQTLEAGLFRIVQEATTNAFKYADAQRMGIKFGVDSNQYTITIRDWGRGFDPESVVADPQQGSRMGLIGIRERARLWGGQCRIESQPGQGTQITVSIPRARVHVMREDNG